MKETERIEERKMFLFVRLLNKQRNRMSICNICLLSFKPSEFYSAKSREIKMAVFEFGYNAE